MHHGGGTAEHDISDVTSQTSELQFLPSVKNMLEEGLLEHDHVTSNTTTYCVTKQLQIDNRKFVHEPTTIVLHKLSCKP